MVGRRVQRINNDTINKGRENTRANDSKSYEEDFQKGIEAANGIGTQQKINSSSHEDDFQKGLEAAKRFEAQQKINNALGTAHKGNFYVTPGSSDIPVQDRLNAALKNVKR